VSLLVSSVRCFPGSAKAELTHGLSRMMKTIKSGS
jgi:hypothetical protein